MVTTFNKTQRGYSLKEVITVHCGYKIWKSKNRYNDKGGRFKSISYQENLIIVKVTNDATGGAAAAAAAEWH